MKRETIGGMSGALGALDHRRQRRERRPRRERHGLRGRAERDEGRGDIDPAMMPTGYSSSTPTRTVSVTTSAMYASTAPAAARPSFDASGTARAKTPIGASSRIAADQPLHGVRHTLRHAQHRVAPLRRHARQRQPEQHRKQDDRQHRTVGGGLHDVRRHEVDEPLRQGRRSGRRTGAAGAGGVAGPRSAIAAF